jgi:hypothetical protein
MSDNLGPNQTRVLDSENRNFESVVYQRRKPPLSSEVNLGGKVDTERVQLAVKSLMPSGVSVVGTIKDGVAISTCEAGSILCSSSFPANTFKFVALDKGQDAQRNTAWVNGWRILMQGTNSSTEDNVIILPAPPTNGSNVNFVFLEVWRKLLSTSDVVYKHGNFLYGGTNYTNDLIDPAMGIETSLRIQIQYRIRVVQDIDIVNNPDGFDPTKVFVQGPLPIPNSTCSQAFFSPVAGDPGLWIAGAGDDVAEGLLGTVDGHTYAIPLFAIRRRSTSSYDQDTRSNGAGKTLANYLVGQASDRPDNLYSDWIVGDDILDMRHKVVPQENVKELCEEAFQKIINNRLPGKMTKVVQGEDNYGVTITKADAIANLSQHAGHPGSTLIGEGDGRRRIFSNASGTQPETFSRFTTSQKFVGTQGLPWVITNAVRVSIGGYPSGAQIIAFRQVYTKELGIINPSHYSVSSIPGTTFTITLTSSFANVIGTSYTLIVDYTVHYASGPNGLTEVPQLFLECRREDSSSLPIAMQDMDIRVRSIGPIITNDGTKFAMLSNRGGYLTEPSDFGHQMIYHVVGTGSNIFTVPRNINGYEILGFVSITSGITAYNPLSVTRNGTTYTVNVGSPITAGNDIVVTLYTSNKFFQANKQGRGIIDCWEMREIIPDETADGARLVFHIDSSNQTILALSTYTGASGAYAYVGGVQTLLSTTHGEFPYDSTRTYGTIRFPFPPNSNPIEVPVLTRSAIDSSEGYTFFYKTLPYQGLLDTSTTGVIEASGPAIITTSGSGTITDASYGTFGIYGNGTQANFNDTTVITGLNTQWLNYVKAGQVISDLDDTRREYIIKEVYNNTTLFLNVVPDNTTIGSWEGYQIIDKDQSLFLQRNIIDLLPTLSSLNDSTATNSSISTQAGNEYPVLETRIVSRIQDIETLPNDSFWIGTNAADRGRSTIKINSEELAPLGLGNLGLKFEKLATTGIYHKTFKAYVINKENSGRIYLMVVGSEDDNLSSTGYFNHASNDDSVDIFELPGKPILMRRIA